jgi:hypothetical protein
LRVASVIGLTRSGDNKSDAKQVCDAILQLVENLGLKVTLRKKGSGCGSAADHFEEGYGWIVEERACA